MVTRVERKIWSSDRGSYIATGETADVDIDAQQLEAEWPARSSGRFLKGPIPWPWIGKAAVLPGQALLVGLCIWRLAGATKNHTVSFGNADLKPLGIGRATKSRALRALEQAGLVEVTHQVGRFPKVTLSSLTREATLTRNHKRHL
jgi:DNA-binding transcriptional ArsR family regulator